MRESVLAEFADPVVPELAYQLDGFVDPEQTIRAAIEILGRLIGCDGLCWNLVDRQSGDVQVIGYPEEIFSGDFSELAELDDHPMIQSYLASGSRPLGDRPRRITDLLDVRAFHHTRTYNELFRRVSVEHMLTVLTDRMNPGAGRCFTFTRSPGVDFSADDVIHAAHLQPVLRAFDVGLAAVAAPPPTDEKTMPTRRELQVALLVSRGLTAQACAHSLRISPGTVRKHLENLYVKLGTHDRISAIAELRRRRLIP